MTHRALGPTDEFILERDEQLAALERVVESVRAGRGALTLIEAAAGLGKSTLLGALAQRAALLGLAGRVLSARCWHSERTLTFGLVRQFYEPVLVGREPHDREHLLSGAAQLAADLFAVPEQHASASEITQDGMLHGLFWLTLNLAGEGPLLLLVDDAHWIDGASARFLLYLAHRLEDLPVGIVLSRRPPEPGTVDLIDEISEGHDVEKLSLDPLSPQAVLELLERHLSGHQVAPSFAAAAHRAAGGNPFFTRALISAIQSERLDPNQANAGAIAALRPDAIRHKVLALISRLGSDASSCASAAALWGDEVSLARVASLSGLPLDRVARSADRLAAAGIFDGASPIVFSHSLVRTVVYEQIPAAQRGRGHLRAAEILHSEYAEPEQVAAQLLPACRADEPWALGALVAAASRAQAKENPQAAIGFLERALDEVASPAVRAELWLKLASAQAHAGHPDAETSAIRALELLEAPPSRAQGLQVLGNIRYSRGDRRGAAHAFEQALELLPPEADDRLARDLRAGYFSAASLDPGLAGRAQQHVEALLTRPSGGETAAERGALAAIAVHLASTGAPCGPTIELAHRAWGDGALLAEEGPDGWAWSLVTAALGWNDAFSDSLAISGAVMLEAQRRGSRMAFATANYTALISYHLGRLDEARAYGDAVFDAMQEDGWRAYLGAAAACQARIIADQGELDEAQAVLMSVGVPEESADRAAWLGAQGHLQLLQGRPSEALEALLAAGTVLDRMAFVNPLLVPWRTDAALAAHRLGDEQLVQRLLGEAIEIVERSEVPSHRAQVLRTRAAVIAPQQAVALLESARELLAGGEATLERLRCTADLGRVLRRLGQRKLACDILTDARQLAHTHGARRIEHEVTRELDVLGAPRARLRFSGADALTARERRIVEMAASGRSNREIAQMLFVTPRTVEQHLYNSYKKLGVNSRTQLAQALADASRRR